MENKEVYRGGVGGGGNLSKPKDALQFGVGFYTIKQSGSAVGKLMVCEGTSQGCTVEHWGLYRTYSWPSSLNQSADLHFDYEGAPSMTVTQFKALLSSGDTYVQATCALETIP